MDFVTATRRFIDQADYLTDQHLPLVATLEAIAIELDSGNRLSAAMLSEYLKSWRMLTASKPPTEPDIGPIEQFLEAHSK